MGKARADRTQAHRDEEKVMVGVERVSEQRHTYTAVGYQVPLHRALLPVLRHFNLDKG